MMNANRAHLVIILREAGAGHDPFGNAEWPSTPAQVWENLPRCSNSPLEGAPLRDRLQMGRPGLGQTVQHQPDPGRPQLGRPDGLQPNGRQPQGLRPDRGQPQLGRPDGPPDARPQRSHPRADEPDERGSDWGQRDRGQPALRLPGRPHQAGRSHRAGTLAVPDLGSPSAPQL